VTSSAVAEFRALGRRKVLSVAGISWPGWHFRAGCTRTPAPRCCGGCLRASIAPQFWAGLSAVRLADTLAGRIVMIVC